MERLGIDMPKKSSKNITPMKIVIVENGSEIPAERSFTQNLIRVGRNPSEADLSFSGWRMVSRKHAEIRSKPDGWVIVDIGSSYGTYVNDEKLTKPHKLSVGDSIKFGTGGPLAHVIWMEHEEGATPSKETPQQSPQELEAQQIRDVPFPTDQKKIKQENKPSIDKKQNMSPVPSGLPTFTPEKVRKELGKPKSTGKARLEPIGDGEKGLELNASEIWIGRENGCDFKIPISEAMVSRRHARILKRADGYYVEDNNSFNGTLVNEKRLVAPTKLENNDSIQLGIGGPVFRFVSEEGGAGSAPQKAGRTPKKPVNATMVFNMGDISSLQKDELENQVLLKTEIGDGQVLTIGRGANNDISLDGLEISGKHARLRLKDASLEIEDLNSTNGLFVNGERITRKRLAQNDSVQIGSYVIRSQRVGEVVVFDTRSQMRIDAIGVTKEVKNRIAGKKIRLLDDISLSVQPNEFVGVIGPSGAGKSTLIDALNGMRPATSGIVYINNLDLYKHIASLKHTIGYVPQEDVIHRELTVYDTLYYVAKLRLPRDVSKAEIRQIIGEVLDVTGLEERRDIPIQKLSGGQRKRVSIAVELITKPSIIFLDEPTSGLDPSTEEKIMKLFRQISESGRTVILTTHAMDNIRLFDKIVILMRGKLVFYGTPKEALDFLKAEKYTDLFEKLVEPIGIASANVGEGNRIQAEEEVAEKWRMQFAKTPEYSRNIAEPLSEVNQNAGGRRSRKKRLGIIGNVSQWAALTSRYTRVLAKDKFNLFILFAQAPILALLVFLVMDNDSPRDFAYFSLSLCAIWFGTSVTARELVRERQIYKRERMVSLGIFPYIKSKLFVLGSVVFMQCFLLWLPLKFFDLTGLMSMPGSWLGIPQFGIMLLTATVGIALGLFISAIVRTSEMATSLIPLILIPQIIFSGLIGVPFGISRVIGLATPAAWSYDSMKRHSTLDTLKPEGAKPDGETRGLGLYDYIQSENDKNFEQAKQDLKSYKSSLEVQMQVAEKKISSGEEVRFRKIPNPPKVPEPLSVPNDLSEYVTYLNPWMHSILNPIILLIMFLSLLVLTLIVLRLQDIKL